jgi:Ca2+-transporting ATPase
VAFTINDHIQGIAAFYRDSASCLIARKLSYPLPRLSGSRLLCMAEHPAATSFSERDVMQIEGRPQAPSETKRATDGYAQPTEALAGALQTDLNPGLKADEIVRRQTQDGPNELPEAPPPSLLKLFLAQFSSLIVWVLIGAAMVSGLLEDWIDAAAILAIVFLNGMLGFVQEFRAERSLAALRKMSVAMARVIREGTLQSIPARDLVTGDVITLEAGDRIPADSRLFYTTNFQAQEASLTGESTPVQKQAELLNATDVPLADQHNMVFMGTVAVSGKAHAVVVATGLGTELGRIASMIRSATEAERAETPLQRRLEQFGYTLLWLALGVVAVVFALGYLRGEPLVEMVLIAVSLAVAAVPEGLPAVVTITLALGVTRMAKRHALIRKLPRSTRLVVDGRLFEVTGEGYEPKGEIRKFSAEARVLSDEVSGKGIGLQSDNSALSTQDFLLVCTTFSPPRCFATVRHYNKRTGPGGSSAIRPKGHCSWRRRRPV